MTKASTFYNRNSDIIWFTFIGLLLILILPPLFKLPVFCSWSFLDYSSTGQIGDTIGGITSPFINLLSAVLVYIAFKEQRNANKLVEKQINTELIQRQLALIKETSPLEKNTVNKIAIYLQTLLNNRDENINDPSKFIYIIPVRTLYKIKYVLALFSQAVEDLFVLGMNGSTNARILLNIYHSLFEDDFIAIQSIFNQLSTSESVTRQQEREIVIAITKLREELQKLSNPNLPSI